MEMLLLQLLIILLRENFLIGKSLEEFCNRKDQKKVAQGLGSWGNNADLIYSDPTDITSDYFAMFYTTPRSFCWFDGKTNAIKAQGPEISANWLSTKCSRLCYI